MINILFDDEGEYKDFIEGNDNWVVFHFYDNTVTKYRVIVTEDVPTYVVQEAIMNGGVVS